jgi:mRNA interferase RelE/StbE
VESYRLLIKASAAKELERVGQKADRRRLVARIESLATDPRPAGCEKLSGAEDKYRVRQGSYRVVYAIDDEARTITIFKIGHRRDVYR